MCSGIKHAKLTSSRIKPVENNIGAPKMRNNYVSYFTYIAIAIMDCSLLLHIKLSLIFFGYILCFFVFGTKPIKNKAKR